MVNAFSFASIIFFIMMFIIANSSAAIVGTIASIFILSALGLNISINPEKPTSVAMIVVLLIFSFKNIAANGSMNSASENRIVVFSASGMMLTL